VADRFESQPQGRTDLPWVVLAVLIGLLLFGAGLTALIWRSAWWIE
jgi:hypothetical protein